VGEGDVEGFEGEAGWWDGNGENAYMQQSGQKRKEKGDGMMKWGRDEESCETQLPQGHAAIECGWKRGDANVPVLLQPTWDKYHLTMVQWRWYLLYDAPPQGVWRKHAALTVLVAGATIEPFATAVCAAWIARAAFVLYCIKT
jgi:hypothetical protein